MIAAEEQTASELQHVTKLYAGTIVLEDMSLTIRRGEVHELIGGNGVGKSTLVGIISGLVTPSSGEIWINGQKYTSLSPVTTKHQRISIITQEPQIIEENTVMKNFFIPGYLDNKGVVDWSKTRRKAVEILDQTGFPTDVSVKMRNLSVNECQLPLVVKAYFVEDTEIVIMDRVSASLSQKDRAILYHAIDDLILAERTVVFISHHTEELLRACDWVTMIRDGHNVGSVVQGNLNKKKLASLVIGSTNYDEQIMEDISAMIQEEEAFVLKNFTNYGKSRSTGMSVRKGEIVGLAGLRGSGRTEPIKSVVGIDTYDRETVWVAGNQRHYRSPAATRSDGILYLTKEREAEGLIPITSVQKNLTVGVLLRISRWGVLQTRKEEQLADDLVRTLDVEAFSRRQSIGQLSGENKQKALVGKIMACTPRVCLLDEPTRGMGIEAEESILNTAHRELRKQSCAIITFPGVEGPIKICDRILILYEGEIINRFFREEFSEKQVYRAMQGEVIHINKVKK